MASFNAPDIRPQVYANPGGLAISGAIAQIPDNLQQGWENRQQRQVVEARRSSLADLPRSATGAPDWAEASRRLAQSGDMEGARSFATLAMADSNQAWTRQQAAQAQANADRSFNFQQQQATQQNARADKGLSLQEQQVARAGVPAGYDLAPGGGVQPMPGGPQDFSAIVERRKQEAQAAGLKPTDSGYSNFLISGNLPVRKPVPAAIQNAEAEDLYGVQNITSINDSLDRISKQIDSGGLQLGPISNAISGVKNFTGLSSPESRNYASFMATLEKLRNDSLRLNKGVQTEGDAVRAWNELVNNVNDPALVKQRIAEITRLNNIAAEYRGNVIQQRRQDNGLEPLDIGKIVVPLPADGAAPKGQGQGASRPPQGGQTIANSPAPSDAAVQALKADPRLSDQFDAKYGAGMAARVLGVK